MAKSPTTSTILDGELLALSERVRQTESLTEIAEGFAARRMSAASDAEPTTIDRITVKLIAQPGASLHVGGLVGKVGGEIVSGDADAQVIIADIPAQALAQVESWEGLARAEAPRHLVRLLDEARGPATGLDAALSLPERSGASGDGVVLGIVDSGADWSHPDFRKQDGSTRFEHFIHAEVVAGVSQYHGYKAAQLDAALANGGSVPQGDPHGHGTHCLSIAAGNGLGSTGQFRGVAPDATLMAMRSEPLLDTHTIRGIRDFFELAGGRPAVVSLSLGGHLGPHDGTSALENVITRESGPGKIIVVAAGNEGSDGIHFSGDLEEGKDLVIRVRVRDQNLQFVDVWIPRDDDVEVWIETPEGVSVDPDGVERATVVGRFLGTWQRDNINRDQNLRLLIGQGRLDHRWRLHVRGVNVQHGRVHAWAGTRSGSNSSLFDGATSPEYSIGMPATADRAISVGSFVSRNSFATNDGVLAAENLQVGQLSDFSSQGPTRFDVQKPDIAAPGHYITAALASGSHMASAPHYVPRHHPNGNYITIQGTSMATPFVAGVIALMLQREPRLTPEEVRERLRLTAHRDDETGRVWNPGFGYGKLDVESLLTYRR